MNSLRSHFSQICSWFLLRSFTTRSTKIFVLLYLLTVLLLFFYSYTQIDLGLTIIRIPSLHALEQQFQYIGYFNRPLSTFFYGVLFLLLYIFYAGFIAMVRSKKIAVSHIISTICIVSPLLIISYNAFSYDLFNYIFDAKIFTYYQQNPYLHKALDYPGDPMLGFMHWTHRVYPYGPVWLGLTVLLSFIGLQYFLLTFMLFKIMMGLAYAGTAIGVYKISQRLFPTHALLNTVFFALSPFVLIESIVSAHNDIVMMFFAIWAFYFLVGKRYWYALIFLLLSIGIKFATIFLLPIFLLLAIVQKRNKHVNFTFWIGMMIFCMAVAVVLASLRTTFQPWYLLFIMPFASLLTKNFYIVIPVTILAFFSQLLYIPYLFTGNWGGNIPTLLLQTQNVAIGLALICTSVYWLYRKICLK